MSSSCQFYFLQPWMIVSPGNRVCTWEGCTDTGCTPQSCLCVHKFWSLLYFHVISSVQKLGLKVYKVLGYPFGLSKDWCHTISSLLRPFWWAGCTRQFSIFILQLVHISRVNPIRSRWWVMPYFVHFIAHLLHLLLHCEAVLLPRTLPVKVLVWEKLQDPTQRCKEFM